MHTVHIIHSYLKQENDSGKRGKILKEAMRATTGLYLPVMNTSYEDSIQERQEDQDPFIVTKEELKDLQKICVENIRQAAESGALKTHPRMEYVLYRWRRWAPLEEPRKWVEGLIESEDGLFSLLSVFLQRSTSQGIWSINLKSLEDFVPVEVLARKIDQLSIGEFGDKAQRAIDAFRRALKRRQEGRADEHWRHDDEDD